MTDRRASLWTRWPDERTGPLWAGIHFAEAGGRVIVVGLEVFTEPPAVARRSLGPSTPDGLATGAWRRRPLRMEDVRSMSLADLVERFRLSIRGTTDGDLADTVTGGTAGGPPTYTDEHWERVAAEYRRAIHAGRADPTQAVADAWSTSHSTAKRWVRKARAMGHLPRWEGQGVVSVT